MTYRHPDIDRYDALLREKTGRVSRQLAETVPLTPDIVPSPPTGFRHRAEFRVWHEGHRSHYVMFDPGPPKQPCIIDTFPVASPRINTLMKAVLHAIHAEPILRRHLFQAGFQSTLSGEGMITLIYHRPLDDAWQTAAESLAETVQASVIGRSRKQKRVVGHDWVTETLYPENAPWHYRQYEGCFSQPNPTVNTAMLRWALDATDNTEGDLLELYCGNGNFTLPLSTRFPRVLATEVNKRAVHALDWGLRHNPAVGRVSHARLSSTEVAQALARVRPFRRLAHVDLEALDLRTLLVDPPRAGLDPDTLRLAAGFESVLYISCNPDTLRDNLKVLATTHQARRFALFDQFPYTPHMECGVLLKRR